MRELVIHQSGPAASIQDSGRTGCLQLGIPPAGAMDADALASGQYLLGHSADEAAIEMAYGNLVASPTEPCHIAVTGAAVDLRIDSISARMHTVLRVEAGQQIQITPGAAGVYSYLHVNGGIDTPETLGSRSTSAREGVGGFDGRRLMNGDCLPLGEPNEPPSDRAGDLTHTPPGDLIRLRFVPGFQYALMQPDVIAALCENDFVVTPKANRMGAQLEGSRLDTGIETLLSEATTHGAIQIPPGGQPIVLLNDRQAVGGYPKPGAVIRSDCRRLAQARPGQRVRFSLCSPAEADRISWLEQHYRDTRLS